MAVSYMADAQKVALEAEINNFLTSFTGTMGSSMGPTDASRKWLQATCIARFTLHVKRGLRRVNVTALRDKVQDSMICAVTCSGIRLCMWSSSIIHCAESAVFLRRCLPARSRSSHSPRHSFASSPTPAFEAGSPVQSCRTNA